MSRAPLLALVACLIRSVPTLAEEPTSIPASPTSNPVADPFEEALADDSTVPTYEIVAETPEDEGTGPSVHRIDRDQLERNGERTAASLLEFETAINATTGRRGERIFSMRGFEQRQVVVLVDGAPAYIPYDGQVNLGLLPGEMIDHITVIKGPASVLYGPNGMGGAVNIVTRRPGSGPLASAAVELGRGNAYDLSGLHTLKIGPVGYVIYGGYAHRDAFPLSAEFEAVSRENGHLRDNSDRTLYHAGATVGWDLNDRHRLAATASYVDGHRGVPLGLKELDARYWRFGSWRSVGTTLSHRGRYGGSGALELELDELVYLRLFDNRLDSYDDDTYATQSSSQAFSSWYHDRMVGGRARARLRWQRAPWGLTDFRLWLGLQNDWHGEEEDGVREEPRERNLVTIAPEAEAFLGERWTVVAGVQLDTELPVSSGEGTAEVGMLLSARWVPVDQLQLRATVARRSRFPTLKERFASAGGTRKDNPTLGSEAAWHFGLEGAWRPLPWMRVALGLYDAEVHDLIVLESLPQDPLYVEQMQNVAAVRLAGADLELSVQPLSWLTARAGYSWLHARRGELRDGSDRLPERPAHRATLQLSAQPMKWIELSSSLRVVTNQSYQNPASGTWGQLSPYARWDARLLLRPAGRWLDVWVRGTNLLDSAYQTDFGFPEPGRQIWVGMRGRY